MEETEVGRTAREMQEAIDERKPFFEALFSGRPQDLFQIESLNTKVDRATTAYHEVSNRAAEQQQ